MVSIGRPWMPLAGAVLAACGVPTFDFSSGGPGDSGTADGGGAGGTGGSGGTAGTGAASSGGLGGADGGGCKTHAECAATPSTPKCSPAGSCVACLPAPDECPADYYCAGTSCKPGCKESVECAPLTCDPIQHECLGCAKDDDCAPGKICELTSTKCVPGCSPSHACDSGKACCSGVCAALVLDPDHCGQCTTVCPVPPNGTRACEGGKCIVKCTVQGSADCNKNPADGCEVDTTKDPANCGICGKTCASGQTCANSGCS